MKDGNPDYIVKDDMICPVTKKHCDDECCPVGSYCNIQAGIDAGISPDSTEECETCKGSGEAMVSCCTGDVVDDDIAMCPRCHEHLGYDECPDCSGTGRVEVGKTDFANKIPGVNTMAEAYRDRLKEGDV